MTNDNRRRSARTLHLRSGAYFYQRALWHNVGDVYDCRVQHTRSQEPRTRHFAEKFGTPHTNAHRMTIRGGRSAVERAQQLMERILADIEAATRAYLGKRFGDPSLPEKLHTQTAHSFRAGATNRVIHRIWAVADIAHSNGNTPPPKRDARDAHACRAGERAGDAISLELN